MLVHGASTDKLPKGRIEALLAHDVAGIRTQKR